MLYQRIHLHNAYHQTMAGVLFMLNPQKPEAQEAAPQDLIPPIQGHARTCERQARPTHAFDFVAANHPYEKLSFEQLGLIPFDPDSVDWWSDNESA